MPRGGYRPGSGRKPKHKFAKGLEAPAVRIADPRPIQLRARDFTHLALAGYVRVLCDPAASHAAVVSAANAVLDRGFGKAVEIKGSFDISAFDGYSTAELTDILDRLRAVPQPHNVIDGNPSGESGATGANGRSETPGIEPDSSVGAGSLPPPRNGRREHSSAAHHSILPELDVPRRVLRPFTRCRRLPRKGG
jgi:hypothetical protein